LENYNKKISKTVTEQESHEDLADYPEPPPRENAVIQKENRDFGEDLDRDIDHLDNIEQLPGIRIH
jgi:hypothetical protein